MMTDRIRLSSEIISFSFKLDKAFDTVYYSRLIKKWDEYDSADLKIVYVTYLNENSAWFHNIKKKYSQLAL